MARLTPDQLANVDLQVRLGRELLDDTREALRRFDYETPEQRRARESRNVCAVCQYIRISRIAGQAFWDWTCGICGKAGAHHNTAVPCYCNECATEHRLCVECGGTVDGKRRRR